MVGQELSNPVLQSMPHKIEGVGRWKVEQGSRDPTFVRLSQFWPDRL